MKRLDYQETTMERFTAYVEALAANRSNAEKAGAALRAAGIEVPPVDWCKQTWDALKAQGVLPQAADAQGQPFTPPWLSRLDGTSCQVPSVCLKLPTGAGKTYLATRCVEQLSRLFHRRATGLVLWIVPSDAIYTQTWKTLANREHPYRMTLERASGGRVKLLRRGDAFQKTDVDNYLCVMVLMMAAASRENTEALKMFQDTGRYPGFLPEEGDELAHKELRRLVPNLEVRDLSGGVPWGAGFAVKESLGNVLCLTRPTIILDEGQTTYTETRRATLAKFNPSFILELSATPNKGAQQMSNVLHSVGGMALKKEEMVKLPLELRNAKTGDWKDTLAAAHGKLQELQALAEQEREESGRYVRPILLIRVERVGKDQRDAGFIHADAVREYLRNGLNVDMAGVVEKSSVEDGLTAHDLMDDQCPVRFIITKDALREGWDCPFAYVLAVLDQLTAGNALTQMVGRILRQPHAQRFPECREELNKSHIYVRRQDVAEAVEKVRTGLKNEGLADLGELVRAAGASGAGGNTRMVTVERRPPFTRRIFLPRILARDGDGWREFDYEGDLLPGVPWEDLTWKGAADFSLDDDSFAHTRSTIDVDQLGPDPRTPLSVAETGIAPELDFPALVRLLVDVIPNPWQAARILRLALAALRARGCTEAEMVASRYRLIETMRVNLQTEIHTHTEKIFCALLAEGALSFRLEGKGLDWALAEKTMTFEVTEPPDRPLHHKANGQPVAKSLFEPVWSKHFNELEKPVAFYLDDVPAVRWWHRLAVQNDGWHLVGWKKSRVFPDFLVALEETNGKPSRLVVVETKGLHLKNEDTDYKRRLFETLEKHSENGVPVGELTLDDQPGPMRFQLVFEQDWKSQVDAALTASKA